MNYLYSVLTHPFQSYSYCRNNYASKAQVLNLIKQGWTEIKLKLLQIMMTVMISHQEIDIHEQCPICLETLLNPINAVNCKHSFCGTCMDECWIHNQYRQLKCPICRSKIKCFAKSFRIEKEQTILCQKFIIPYNLRFGNYILLQPFQTIQSTYTYLKQLWKQIYDLAKLLTNLTLMVLLALLTIYVVSPIDLIPELYFGLLGLVDDILCIFFIVWIVCTLMFLR